MQRGIWPADAQDGPWWAPTAVVLAVGAACGGSWWLAAQIAALVIGR